MSEQARALCRGQPDKAQGIGCLAVSSRAGLGDSESAVLATSRASGTVDILNPCAAELLASIPAAAPASNGASNGSSSSSSSISSHSEAAAVRGLHWVWAGGAAEGAPALPALLTVTQGGAARLHAAVPWPTEDEGTSWEQLRAWQVPVEVCCTAYDPGSSRLAVGCQGTELRLFDAAAGQLVYAAKGGRPNKVGLVDKPWNTALAFLPDVARGAAPTAAGSSQGSSDSGSGNVLLVGTGYHKLRLYDVRAGKRPQAELAFGDARITALAPEPDGLRCWVGTGLGQLEVLDLRTLKLAGGIRGIAGSLRALAVHPQRPILASVGLDRFLRLHDTRTRQPLAKVYLKQQLTGVQFCPVTPEMLPQQQAGQHAEQQQDGDAEDRKARKKEKRRKEGGGSSSKKEKRTKKA
ncbi:hypothetical protein N2152v2_003749 [Parachlorella kessleri]